MAVVTMRYLVLQAATLALTITLAAPAPASSTAEPLKAAWVYDGLIGEVGWTFAHEQGRLEVEASFGDKVNTTFLELVVTGAEAETAVRELVS